MRLPVTGHRMAVLSALALLTAPAFATAQAPAAPAPTEGAPRGEVEAAKLSKVPKQTKFVDAEYPAAAAEKQIEADVILLLDIDDKGKVTGVNIAEPATVPDMGFDEAALVAAQQFEFEPAEIDGKPIAVQISYRYRFVQKAKPPEIAPGAGTPPGGAAAAKPVAPARTPVVNFSGLLRERGTRLPMAGVVVTVFRDDEPAPVGYETTSNPEGKFQFFDLAAGPWKVLVEQPGYYPFRTTEDVLAGQATAVTYYVERASYNPYDVTVTAQRERKEVSRTIISAKEIDKIPGTFGDPLAVIQNFAGVARVPVGSGQIIIRGSEPLDSKVFVDGVEVPNIYHFGGLRSVIPIGMLEGIEFYPGNFGPEYGRAIGGVIDVKTKKLAPKKIGGYADISLLDTSLFLEIPISDKGSIAFAGRQSYVGYIIKAATPSDAPVNVIAAPRYYDFQILGNYRPTKAHDLRLFLFGADDRLELLFENPGDNALTSGRFSAGTNFNRLSLSDRYVPSTSFSNFLRLSIGRDKWDFRVGTLVFDLEVEQFQLRDNVEHKLSDFITLNYGADVVISRSSAFIRLPPPPKEGEPMGMDSNFNLADTRTSQFAGDYLYSPAAFFEAALKPIANLRLFPGVRAEHFTRIKQSVVSPRFTARYQLNKKFLIKGGAGLFMQEPFFDETDPAFGNPDLNVEKALHYSLGGEYRPRQHLSLDAIVFYKDLTNQVSPTDRVVQRNGQPRPLFYDNNGKGRVYGLELVGRHELSSNFTGWLAYTLSRAERTDSGESKGRLFDYDQTHILTVIGSYLLPRNWQVGGRFRLVSGNPRTPVVGSVYNASADRYNAVFGGTNTARDSAFHQLDLRVDKNWIYDGWILNVYLDIQNVYNRANQEGLNYNFNFTKSKPRQSLPLFPILGIRGSF